LKKGGYKIFGAFVIAQQKRFTPLKLVAGFQEKNKSGASLKKRSGGENAPPPPTQQCGEVYYNTHEARERREKYR